MVCTPHLGILLIHWDPFGAAMIRGRWDTDDSRNQSRPFITSKCFLRQAIKVLVRLELICGEKASLKNLHFMLFNSWSFNRIP